MIIYILLYKCCLNSKKDEEYGKDTSTNTESERIRSSSTIQSHIDTESKYKNEEYIKISLSNTEIKDLENDDEDVSPELISKLEKIVSKAPKLELLIKDSLFLKIGLKIKINALGLEDKSLRNKKDGITYFGLISPDDDIKNLNIDFSTIDQINNINNFGDNIVNYGRQFLIKFDINEYCYFIKDCSYGKGYGSFMKIVNETKLKDNTLINIGDNYIVFTFGVDDLEPNENNISENEKILSVKVFAGELNNYSYVFNQSQINKIYIGKNDKCNIALNDDLLDDIHCTIEYKERIGWIIIDGYNGKNSEKGTWFGLSEKTKIFEGMIIQSNQNIYQCHIIK